jgi:hypothetical protein
VPEPPGAHHLEEGLGDLVLGHPEVVNIQYI